jgi:hypothetical protein
MRRHRHPRRRPTCPGASSRKTPLSAIVEEYLAVLTKALASQNASLPGFVVNEFREYLPAKTHRRQQTSTTTR